MSSNGRFFAMRSTSVLSLKHAYALHTPPFRSKSLWPQALHSSLFTDADNATDTKDDRLDNVPSPGKAAEKISGGTTIIVAGCFGMACSQLTLCPAGIEFSQQRMKSILQHGACKHLVVTHMSG